MPGPTLTGFLLLIAIAMPWRAWRRWMRGAPPVAGWVHVLETTVLTIVLLSILHWENVPLALIGLRPATLPEFSIHLLIGLFIVVSPDIVSVLLRTLDPQPVKRVHLRRFEAIPSGKGAIAFIPVCLTSAFWEEICFRGTALHVASHGVAGTAVGVVLSSLIFGLHHFRQGPLSVVFTAAFGLAFCALYLTTHDLLAVMAAHALGNLAVVYYFAPAARRSRTC